MSVKKINTANFEAEILNAGGTALIDFYADWCGPCRMVAPIVAEISEERADVTVGKIDVDESPELAARYGVSSIPTVIAFENGRETGRIIGYRPKQDILNLL